MLCYYITTMDCPTARPAGPEMDSFMSGQELTSLVVAGFLAAALHASLPTHWLAFVAAARAQGWSMGKTLRINLAAGAGHVAFTALLGFLIAWVGLNLPEEAIEWGGWFGGVLLIALGAYAIWRERHGKDPHILGHHHTEACHHGIPGLPGETVTVAARDGSAAVTGNARTQALTIGGLFALVTFSPCEAYLPIYVAGISHGWTGFLLLTAVLAVGTLGGMVFLTWLTFHSAERMKFQVLERHEGAIIGVVLVALGTFVLMAGH